MKNKKVEVSICCITYNQKKYISETIDSFLMQKTNFNFEILIHDDCSTDGTIEILKEYEKKYPKLIKVIYEDENQYSKGKKMFPILHKICRGKYIALCEGDDYWCDANKLQMQFEYMETHPDCSLTVHTSYLFDDVTKRKIIKSQPYKGTREYSTYEIILGDGGLFVTNSMFYRKKYVDDLPRFYFNSPVEDFPLTIYLSLCGNVHFIDKAMSVYRTNAAGSWSMAQKSDDIKEVEIKRIKLNEGLKNMLYELDKETKFKYHDAIELFLIEKELEKLVSINRIEELKDDKFKKLYSLYDLKGKIKLFLMRKLPGVYKFLKGVVNGKQSSR